MRSDKALREQVERLLGLSQSAGDFFKECAPALEPKAADAAQILSAAESALETEICETKRIGPSKLLQKLGEGGCGVVYMAVQEQPIRRRVELKIIKLEMDDFDIAKATEQRLTDRTLFTSYAQLMGTPAQAASREKVTRAALLASQDKYEEAERSLRQPHPQSQSSAGGG